MYSLIALLAGAAAKLYDDLEDNNFLQKFRNSTLMEFLKGLHYISFTAASIEEPLFFIFQYLCNIVYFFGKTEAYSKPYEKSLLYSFLLLFIIIDYKKIISLCLIDKLISIFDVLVFALEPLVGFDIIHEYSFAKMNCRIIIMILQITLCYFIRSNSLRYITVYFIGYLFISVLVQYYSLRMEKLKIEIEKEKEIEEKEVKKEIEKEVEVKVKEKEVKEKEIEIEKEVKVKEKEIEKEVKEIEIEEKEVKKEK